MMSEQTLDDIYENLEKKCKDKFGITHQKLQSNVYTSVINHENDYFKEMIEGYGDISIPQKSPKFYDGGWTIAHMAARTNNIEVLEYLHKNECNFYILNKKGETAVHIAAEYGCFETIKFFREINFDINKKDKNGKTPYDIILEKINVCLLVEMLSNFNECKKIFEKPTKSANKITMPSCK